MNNLKSEFKKYIKKNELEINLSDFTTIEKSFNHSLRFELGDKLKNGTKERVNQAKKRALEIFNTCFEKEDNLFVLTYEWNTENNFLARTPDFLYQILQVEKSQEKQKLSLMYFKDEEPEYEDGFLGVYKFKKASINLEKLFEGIANTDMGFNPTIHQIVYFFGETSKKMFWMYDDRGCLIMSQNLIDLKPDYNTHQKWLCERYKKDFKEKKQYDKE
ncbi:DUF3885 domain-containing protein [Aureivirga sp. CE67]|uniref:DUF3885 domain-containing protein n=1 Tax=Aureivirga sp. CE67 TaxID=1788983 RepID=UPI0018CA71A3|nr:DUF3885 domain-containing protein [Aureivirga sp. CE67]